jgi:hypothetical protein
MTSSTNYAPSDWQQRVSDFGVEVEVNVPYLTAIAKMVEDTSGVLAKLDSRTQTQLDILQDPNVMAGETADAIRTQLSHDLQQVRQMTERLINSGLPGKIRDVSDAIISANAGIQSLNRGLASMTVFGYRLPVWPLSHFESSMLEQSQGSVDDVRNKYQALNEALTPYILGPDAIDWKSATT